MKGVMSFADEVRRGPSSMLVRMLTRRCAQDLLAALNHTKQCVLIASQHRKKAPYLTSRLAGYVYVDWSNV